MPIDSPPQRPNGLQMSRPASQDEYRAKAKYRAGRVGSIELLGGIRCLNGIVDW